MGENLYNKIESLIHDTSTAFKACEGTVNADYAEFASMAISEFKEILGNPNLRRYELTEILRKSMARSHTPDPYQWTILMASQIEKAANKRN